MRPFFGIWPVAPTPFRDDGSINLEGMKRVLDQMVDQSVDGICILANFSEQFLVSDEERDTLTRLCLDYIAGRMPAIVTVCHFATEIVVSRARQAKELGANVVMKMAPYHGVLLKGTPAQTFEQFAKVGEAGIPIMCQDAPLSGVDLPVPLLARMAREIKMLKLSKIECPGIATKLRGLIAEGGEAIERPFDGEEAITPLADLDAGTTGSMNSTLIPKMIKPVITHHLAGHREVAKAAYARVSPTINHENRHCGFRGTKEAMVGGGIIKSAYCRHPIPALPPASRAELIDHLRPLDPMILRWAA